MDLQNHSRRVCHIAADAGYKSASEAEKVAMRYDQLVRQKLWDKCRQTPELPLAPYGW